MRHLTYTVTTILILFFGTGLCGLSAQNGADTEEEDNVTVSPNRPTVSELRIRGRIQTQFAYSNGNNENTGVSAEEYSSFEMRRIRLGVQGKLFEDWDFMVEANVYSTVGLDAATLTYTGIPGAHVTVGKAKTFFGHEQLTSSASILTFERTRLDGHLNGGKPVGLRVHHSGNLFTYYLGVYNGQSTGTGRMGSGMDSYLVNASIGFNIGSLISDEYRADFRADYLHSGDESGYYSFEDGIAISGHFGASNIDLRSEFMSGKRFDGDRISGFYLLPSYYIVPEKFQAVLRFEKLKGASGIGVGHNRYADRVPGLYGGGNEYYALYAGVNYFIYGDNLKLMFGFERAENSGEVIDVKGQVITIFTGVRMQF